MKKILVTGGAGYIGSHTVQELMKSGYDVTVFDNLVYGHRQAVNCPLVVGDLLNENEVEKLFSAHKFDGVIHFAAYSQAGESMKLPDKYFENNIQGGVNLLKVMTTHDVKNIVFSSTCATYGYPKKLPVAEEEDKNPVSVYGESKLMFEKVLDWYERLFEVKNIKLRYFNACGASLDGSIGEDHLPETHIIPIAMECALGKRDKFTIFGDDYNTPDGTNIRDYIHVVDLASAHIKALEYLFDKKLSDMFNVGSGFGFSNTQILNKVKEITTVDFPVEIGSRREGDPDEIYADNAKIQKVLGWKPMYSDLDTIIETSWRWHQKNPNGYGDK